MRFNFLITIIILFLFSSGTAFTQNLPEWIKLNSPTDQHLSEMFFRDSTTGWVGGDSGTIIRTTDGGLTWETLYNADLTYILDIFFLNSNLGWVLYWDNTPPLESRILKTYDGGINWDTASCPGENTFYNSIFFTDSLTGFLAGPPIMKTTDGGNSWLETYVYDVDTLPPDISTLPVNNFEFYDKKRGYACGGFRDLAGVMWSTADSGNSWAAKGLSADEIYDLHIFDSVTVSALSGDPEGYFPIGHIRSTDGGTSWNTDTTSFYGLPNSLSFRTFAEGWGVKWNYFLVTTDTGKTWIEFPVAGDYTLSAIQFTDSLTGYAAGSNGTILKYKINSPSGINEENVPKHFYLHRNYPNPFNPSTTIEYELSETGLVELVVYDILGRKISELVNEVQIPGSYKVSFSGTGLPSGVYFCLLRNGTEALITKMTLLK